MYVFIFLTISNASVSGNSIISFLILLSDHATKPTLDTILLTAYIENSKSQLDKAPWSPVLDKYPPEKVLYPVHALCDLFTSKGALGSFVPIPTLPRLDIRIRSTVSSDELCLPRYV